MRFVSSGCRRLISLLMLRISRTIIFSYCVWMFFKAVLKVSIAIVESVPSTVAINPKIFQGSEFMLLDCVFRISVTSRSLASKLAIRSLTFVEHSICVFSSLLILLNISSAIYII